MENKFAERIKELRKEKGWTQAQLASNLGYKRTAITKWETKNKEPEYNILIKISELFGVTIDYLLGNEDY